MSYLAFHFQEGVELHLKGAERHYLGSIVDNAAFGAIGFVAGLYSSDAIESLKPFIPEGWLSKQRDGQRLAEDFKLNFSWGKTFLTWRGKDIKSFSLLLNTAIVAGSDPVALAAKMHGTCEIHGRFLGKDRAWLADVIEQGVDTGIFRRSFWAPRDPTAELRVMMRQPVTEEEAEMVVHSMGWTEIIEQLRTSDKGAVVMSYSVTDGFPEMPKDWTPKEPLRAPESDWETLRDIKYEAFSELPEEERFVLGLQHLEESSSNVPIGPETLRGELFRHELTLLDLLRGDVQKINKKLELDD